MATPEEAVAVKVAGSLSGVVQLPSYNSSVGSLRGEIARLLELDDPSGVKLICLGRTLQDDGQTLAQAGITPTSRVLVTKGAATSGALAAQEERTRRLEKLRRVMAAMAARSGRGLGEEYEFSLVNQAGQAMQLSEGDRKALVAGLALADKGKASLEAGDYAGALGELLMADEAFSLCEPATLEAVDNPALLQLDIVWACWKLNDVARLGVCRDRLARAAAGLQRAHGPGMERARQLHGSHCPVMAVYLRLEVLQGVVAYHCQELEAAARHLAAAKALWQALQVSDAALAQLAEMGYGSKMAKRALRACGGDVGAATAFIEEHKAKQAESKEQRKAQRSWNAERVRYGTTDEGEYVDMQALEGLCSFGCDRRLAAEALRQCRNHPSNALELMLDDVRRSALALALALAAGPGTTSSTTDAAAGPGTQTSTDADAEDGQEAAGDDDAAAGSSAVGPSSSAPGSSRGAALSGQRRHGRSAAASSAADGGEAGHGEEHNPDGGGAARRPTESDEELEAEIVAKVKSDPLAAYDFEVDEEGGLIDTMLALMNSRQAQ